MGLKDELDYLEGEERYVGELQAHSRAAGDKLRSAGRVRSEGLTFDVSAPATPVLAPRRQS